MSALHSLNTSGHRDRKRINQRSARLIRISDQPVLSPPRDWKGGKTRWHRIVLRSRRYANTRFAKLMDSASEQAIEEAFDDLTAVASHIGRNISLTDLQEWLSRRDMQAHPDAKALCNLLCLMDAFEVF